MDDFEPTRPGPSSTTSMSLPLSQIEGLINGGCLHLLPGGSSEERSRSNGNGGEVDEDWEDEEVVEDVVIEPAASYNLDMVNVSPNTTLQQSLPNYKPDARALDNLRFTNGLDLDDWGNNGNELNPSPWLFQPPKQGDLIRLAILRGDTQFVINALKDEGQGVKVYINGWPVLLYALQAGQWDLVTYLLDHGANPQAKGDKDGHTGLMVLTYCTKLEMEEDKVLEFARLLWNKNVSLELKDLKYGQSALIFAVGANNHNLAKLYLESGAPVNTTDFSSRNALILAASKGNLEMVQLLLKHGADIYQVDKNGLIAAELACFNGHLEVCKFLHELTLAAKPSEEDVESVYRETVLNVAEVSKRYDEDGFQLRDTCLEMMMTSLGLSDYISNFTKNGVKFVDFLTMNENDLKKIGFTLVGPRLKLLTAIRDLHNASWTPESLVHQPFHNGISSTLAFAMIENLVFHFSYMGQSLKYVQERVEYDPENIQNFETQASNLINVAGDLTTIALDVDSVFKSVEHCVELRVGDVPTKKKNYIPMVCSGLLLAFIGVKFGLLSQLRRLVSR